MAIKKMEKPMNSDPEAQNKHLVGYISLFGKISTKKLI